MPPSGSEIPCSPGLQRLQATTLTPVLHEPQPILVVGLFPAERAALLDVLRSLPIEGWLRRTAAGDWTIKDLAGHIVGDDLGRLSRQRDGYRVEAETGETLGERIDRLNAEWVAATRRLSPQVLLSLLATTGEETQAFFASLDPFTVGPPVSWAGPEPAPVWLDLARELTERWHHQQQIREALGVAVLDDPTYLRPVLSVCAYALVPALAEAEPADGTAVELCVTGPSGGSWTILRSRGRWQLLVGEGGSPSARVTLDEATAWRMYFGALPRAEVARRAQLVGDERLGTAIFEAHALLS